MESLTLPTTAAQAKAFIAPSSLSFPMSHADQIAERNGLVNGAGMNGSATPAPVAAQTVNGHGAEAKETVTTGGVSGIVPTLQNIVATVNLDCRLDLKTIALHARNAEYNPKVYRLLHLFSTLY